MDRLESAVPAEIPYIVNTGENLVNETFGPNNIRRRRTGTQELRRVDIHNGRLHPEQFSLDGSGFVLTGVVRSEVERAVLLNAATGVVGADHVTDRLGRVTSVMLTLFGMGR